MTQPLIKIVLLSAIAVVAVFAIRGGTKAMHRVVWRGYVLVMVVSAALSVLFPNALTWIAHKLGVGRGADLLLYVLAVTVMLISVILFRRLAELERKYVALARALALREAHDSELRGSTSDGQRAGD